MAEIPTLQELKDQFLSDLESETGKSAPLLPVSVWRVIATAVAGIAYLIYKYGEWITRQIFVLTADEESLLARGAEYGLFPTESREFVGSATVTGTNGTVIPIGKRYTAGQFVYQVSLGSTISAGVATVQIEALTLGEEPSLSVSDTLTEASPTAGLDPVITVSAIVQSGQDSESLENFRNRVDIRQKQPPQGGAVADYVLWSLEVPGIGEAYPSRPSPGFINVYPLTNDPDPVNRIPDLTKRNEVLAYVSSTRRRPLNDAVSVLAFTEFEVAVAISNLVPNTAETRNRIQTAISDYLWSRRPLLYDDDPAPRNQISLSDCYTLAGLAGARSVTVAITSSGKTFPYTLLASEISKPGTFTFS